MKCVENKPDFLTVMEEMNRVVQQFADLDFGTDNELVKKFCEYCSVLPASPLAFAFFSFVSGVEYGQAQAEDSETE